MATKNISVRIPDELYERIKAASKKDLRSLNSQILWLIAAGLDAGGRSG